jgi:carbonic anhydrase
MKCWKLIGLGVVAVVTVHAGDTPAGQTDSTARLLREASLAILKEGNARYVSGRLQHPNLDGARRTNTVVEGQEPFATILACSDSRDPVELIFDRGVGDLFVVRVAGNVAGISETATVEYGVGHLHTPLLVVMGHTKCGAVTAVVTGAELHGQLPKLAERIRPAAIRAAAESPKPAEAVPGAIRENVWQSISDLVRTSETIRDAAAGGKLAIVGAIYHLDSGEVEWLGPHPKFDSLLTAVEESSPFGVATTEASRPSSLLRPLVPKPRPVDLPVDLREQGTGKGSAPTPH